MLTTFASFMWSSAPVMNAILTILLLVIIRMWSRTSSPITEHIIKIGKNVEKAGNELVNQTEESEKVYKSIDYTTEQLDVLFFGELFIAALMSGIIVKYMW